jgi:hypothetical protein
MSYWLPIILLEYELWKYIYPKEIITDNVPQQIKKVLINYKEYISISNRYVKTINKKLVIGNLTKKIS